MHPARPGEPHGMLPAAEERLMTTPFLRATMPGITSLLIKVVELTLRLTRLFSSSTGEKGVMNGIGSFHGFHGLCDERGAKVVV